MEITKERKEKLMKAGSKEELKAMLGEKASEEETAKLWYELRKTREREPSDLEKVDDDELEAVSGGHCTTLWSGPDALDGHEIGCLYWYYRSREQADDEVCPMSEPKFDWAHSYELNIEAKTATCKKCGHVMKNVVVSPNRN